MNITVSSLALRRFIRPTLFSGFTLNMKSRINIANSIFKFGYTNNFLKSYDSFKVIKTSIIRVSNTQPESNTLKRVRVEDPQTNITQISCFEGCFLGEGLTFGDIGTIEFKQCFISAVELYTNAVLDRCTAYGICYFCGDTKMNFTNFYPDSYIEILSLSYNCNLTALSSNPIESSVYMFSSFREFKMATMVKYNVSYVSFIQSTQLYFKQSTLSSVAFVDCVGVTIKSTLLENTYSSAKVNLVDCVNTINIISTVIPDVPYCTPIKERKTVVYDIRNKKQISFLF